MQITSRRLTAAALLAMSAHGAVNVFERKPSAGPAPGDCQIFTEGKSELTLCLNKKNPDGGEVVVINGVLFNSGTTDLCNIKLEARGSAGAIQNIWPDWATGGQADFTFTPGQVSDVGVTVEGANGALPTIGLVGFESCAGGEKYSEETSTLRYVSMDNVKLPAKPAADPAPANNGEKKDAPKQDAPKNDAPKANEPPKEEKKPAAKVEGDVIDHTKHSVEVVGDKIVEVVEQPLTAGPAVGQCQQYVEGESGVTLCLQSAEDGVVHGFLFNSGSKDICKLKLEVTGAAKGATKDFWPDWAVGAPKEEMIFAPKQKTDVGFTLADGADGSTSSILVTDYEICGTKEGLKKDTKVKTVPIGEVAVPEAPKAEEAPKKAVAAPKADADAVAQEAAKPASTRFLRRF